MQRLMKPLNRRLCLVLIVLPLISAFAVSTFAERSSQHISLSLTPEITPESTAEVEVDYSAYDFSVYDPVQFGIPAKLAGYDVLAVFSEDNTACKPEGFHTVVVQVNHADMEAYLASDTATSLRAEMDKLGKTFDAKWVLSIVGPAAVKERMLAEHDRRNIQLRTHGCVRFGGPIILATPSPTP